MPEPYSPAFRFHPSSYVLDRQSLMGRQMANNQFLRGLLKHGGLHKLSGYLLSRDLEEQFEKVVHDIDADMPVEAIKPHELERLKERGGLFIDDPLVPAQARLRSFIGSAAYTLTGLTHTTAEASVKGEISDLLTCGMQPWDALICTSRAVLSMVQEIFDAERERLSQALGATRFPEMLLPVIPLGIDTGTFERREEWRAEWRKRLRIGADEIAVLYFGRLTRANKAHPLPMLAALGRAMPARPQHVHLILAGWWEFPPEEAIWREQAALLCPEVRLHVVDGRGEKVRQEMWSAADIFISLIDNIQETFGLAPVEAMASGLPAVVTDWDGYRDTVRHGIDGMLVPTMMAAPGKGVGIARNYAAGRLSYGGMLTEVARMTVVDIPAAAQALGALFADANLRQRMGAAGRARAQQAFDWAAIIPQYQALWQQQQDIRIAALRGEDGSASAPNPRHMDPMQAFRAWPTRTFSLSQRLRAEPNPVTEDVVCLLNFASSALPSELHEDEIVRLLSELRHRGESSAADLLTILDPSMVEAGEKALLWLMRTGLVAAA